MFTLQYSVTNEGFPEIEIFETLQLALIRLQELSNRTDQPNFVAEILFDNQDDDGQIYDVVFYSEYGGYEFSTEVLPKPSGNPIPYYKRNI